MVGDKTTTATIQELMAEGAILAHKDGNYGSYYPRVEEFGSEGVPFLTAKSLRDGYVDIAKAPRLADARADELTFGFVKTDDVLLSHNATIGRVAVVPPYEGRLLVGTSLTYFRLNPQKILPRYLAVYFSGADFQNQLTAVMSHSTRNQVPVTAQRLLKVIVPPLLEQKAVAGILGTLDDKIELNRRTSLTLERMATAIFRAWFVGFEPVKAKAAGAQSFPGMPQKAFDALPHRFVDSELGPIPEGWETRSLDQTGGFLNGLALQKFPPHGSDSDLPVVKIAELRKGNVQGSDRANGNIPSPYKILDGDLLFSWSGTLEVRLWFGGPGALNQHLFKVTSEEFPKWLMKSWIEQHLSHFRMIAASKATTMGHINRGHLTEAKVVVPGKNTLEAADQLVGRLSDLYSNLQVQNRQLAATRDFLLPRLLSGQVRLKDKA